MSRKNVSRRRLLKLMGLGIAGTTLAACQPKVVKETVVVEKEKVVKEEVEVEKEVTRVVEKEVEKAAEEPVTLHPVVMTFSWNEAQDALLPNFLENHPHINIEPIVVPGWAEYPGKVAAMFAANNLGDVIEFNAGPDFNVWAHRGIVRPLDDLVESTDFEIEAFFPAGIEACTHEGHLVAIPAHTHPGTVIVTYNKQLFDEAGVDYPTSEWTYPEYVEVAEKLTQDTNGDGKTDIWGTFPHGTDSMRHLYPRLRSNGGQWFDETCHESIADQPEAIKTFKQFYDLIWTYKVEPIPGATEDYDVLYRSGKLAMRPQPAKHSINMQSATADLFESGSCTIPKNAETGKIGSATTGVSYGMTTLTQHPQETWEYMTWLGSEWFCVEAMLGGFIDPGGRRDAWEDPRMEELWPLAPRIVALFEESEAEEVVWNLRHQEVNRTFSSICGEIMHDEVSVEEGAERIKQEVDAILKQPMI